MILFERIRRLFRGRTVTFEGLELIPEEEDQRYFLLPPIEKIGDDQEHWEFIETHLLPESVDEVKTYLRMQAGWQLE